jgi:hypothetical protein
MVAADTGAVPSEAGVSMEEDSAADMAIDS